MSNFIEECVNGKARISDVDDYVDLWHETKTDQSISEFLGMTNKEYELFVKDEKYLESIITAHKESKDIEHVLHEKNENYLKSQKK